MARSLLATISFHAPRHLDLTYLCIVHFHFIRWYGVVHNTLPERLLRFHYWSPRPLMLTQAKPQVSIHFQYLTSIAQPALHCPRHQPALPQSKAVDKRERCLSIMKLSYLPENLRPYPVS
jgi:hypothetical protein